MPGNYDNSLSWTDHFAKYGFTVLRGLVDRDFCERGIDRVRQIVGHNLPLSDWSTENTPTLYQPFFEGGNAPDPVLEQVFQQPRLRQAIETLYGGPGHWDEAKNYYLFLKPYNPKAKASLVPRGHIDFPKSGTPRLYRGFTFQLAMADTEPFGGNLTVHPGSQAVVQKKLIEDPWFELKGGVATDLDIEPPFEFVAKAGDVLFMHHMMVHSGNEAHGEGKRSRVAIHGEAFRTKWLTSLDPSAKGLSPWERSLAHNGPCHELPEIIKEQTTKRDQYVADLRKKEDEKAAAAAK
jgi:hypothetical protein